MILLGSRAAKIWFPDFRHPNDYDIVGTDTEYRNLLSNMKYVTNIVEKPHKKKIIQTKDEKQTIIEFEFDVSKSSTILLANQPLYRKGRLLGLDMHIASPATLWLTKRSHLYWRIHWDKSINDMHWIRARSDAPEEHDLEFYHQRLAESKQRFGQEFSYDVSEYDLEEFKTKVIYMTKKKFKTFTPENYENVLKKICVSREFGSSSEFVIEHYTELKNIDSNDSRIL